MLNIMMDTYDTIYQCILMQTWMTILTSFSFFHSLWMGFQPSPNGRSRCIWMGFPHYIHINITRFP